MSERETVVETVEVQTGGVTTPAAPIASSQQPMANGQQPLADLGKVRELVLKAHPDVVPDLVAGSSVDELIASVEPARTAYQRIADQVRRADPIVAQPPVVPAGGAANVAEPGDLGPTTKIAQALAARKRQ